MPKYAIDEGAEPRLVIEGGRFGKAIRVTFDGREIASGTPASFDKVRTFDLGDGIGVTLRRVKGGFEVSRDGRALRGSVHHPVTAIQTAANLLFAIAAITALAGLVFILWIDQEGASIAGAAMLFFASVYGGLGFGVRRGLLPCLWVGIVLYLLDTLVCLLSLAIPAVAVHIVFLVAMFGAAKRVKEARARAARASHRAPAV